MNSLLYVSLSLLAFNCYGKRMQIITSHIIPKTKNQMEYNHMLSNYEKKIVIGTGPAGCGKTLLACNEAIKQLKTNNVSKIVITRPTVSVDDEQIGFLPGTMNEKMDPWTRPIFDIFYEFFNKQQVKTMLDDDIVEIVPLAYMRGRTFKNSFIIADEMQNSSPNQMLMLLTRIGENTKLVITGDLDQTDRNDINGLADFLNKIKHCCNLSKYISYIEMSLEDIQRSEVLKSIIDLYKNKNNYKNII